MDLTRNEVIAKIKADLKARTGMAWSVKGGRGTAYGWITICAPAKRCTLHSQLKAGATSTWPEDYELVDNGQPDGYMTDADLATLRTALGEGASVDRSGVSIPSSNAYYQEFLDRAAGRQPSVIGTPYWD